MSTEVTNHSQNIETKSNTNKNIPPIVAYTLATAAGGIFNYATIKPISKIHNNESKKMSAFITPDIVDKTMNLQEIKDLDVTLRDIIWDGDTNEAVKELKKEAKTLHDKKLSKKAFYRIKKYGVDNLRKTKN